MKFCVERKFGRERAEKVIDDIENYANCINLNIALEKCKVFITGEEIKIL